MNTQKVLEKFPDLIENTKRPDWSYKTEKSWHYETKFHLNILLDEIEVIHEKLQNVTKGMVNKKDSMIEVLDVNIWYLEAMIVSWWWASLEEVKEILKK